MFDLSQPRNMAANTRGLHGNYVTKAYPLSPVPAFSYDRYIFHKKRCSGLILATQNFCRKLGPI